MAAYITIGITALICVITFILLSKMKKEGYALVVSKWKKGVFLVANALFIVGKMTTFLEPYSDTFFSDMMLALLVIIVISMYFFASCLFLPTLIRWISKRETITYGIPICIVLCVASFYSGAILFAGLEGGASMVLPIAYALIGDSILSIEKTNTTEI